MAKIPRKPTAKQVAAAKRKPQRPHRDCHECGGNRNYCGAICGKCGAEHCFYIHKSHHSFNFRPKLCNPCAEKSGIFMPCKGCMYHGGCRDKCALGRV